MSEAINAVGQCLCGAVKIDAQDLKSSVHACHCGMCRNWGGGPFFAIDCQGSVEIESENNIATFESSEWAERGFCKKCGTHLFYKLNQNQQYIFSAGIFDLDEELNFDQQYFIDKKPVFYHFENKTKNITEAELFMMFDGT